MKKKPAKMFPEKSGNEILEINDRPFFPVQVPQWGCTVWCQELDMATTFAIKNSSKGEDGKQNQEDYVIKTVLEGCYDKLPSGQFKKKFSPTAYEKLKTKGGGLAVVFVAIENGKKNEITKS